MSSSDKENQDSKADIQAFRELLFPRINEIKNHIKYVKRASEVIKLYPFMLEKFSSLNSDLENELKPFLKDGEEFADEVTLEIQKGFPTLFNLSVVLMHGAFDSCLRDFLIGLLVEYEEAREIDKIQNIRINYKNVYKSNEKEFFRYLFSELERSISAPNNRGVKKYLSMLEVFSIKPAINKKVEKDITELIGIRNVLVHCGGFVDSQFIQLCPWYKCELRQQIKVNEEQFTRYHNSMFSLIYEVLKSLKETPFIDDG